MRDSARPSAWPGLSRSESEQDGARTQINEDSKQQAAATHGHPAAKVNDHFHPDEKNEKERQAAEQDLHDARDHQKGAAIGGRGGREDGRNFRSRVGLAKAGGQHPVGKAHRAGRAEERLPRGAESALVDCE